MISILLHFQNDRKTRKKLQISESDLAKFSALLGFSPFFYVFPPIDEETLYARAPRVSARADVTTSQIDPGRDGELARRVSHDVAAWSAKPRHRATRERRGAHAIEFKSRASTDEVGSSRRRAHTTGEREAAEA